DQEDADRAVVLLAEPAVVLPGHDGEVRPLLGEGRLVDHPDGPDGRAGCRGDQLVGEQGLRLGHHVVVAPGSSPDELLQTRDVAVSDQQGNRPDALALGADHHVVRIDWIGGTSTEHALRRPISRYARLSDFPRTRSLVEAAVAAGQPAEQIAQRLNRARVPPASPPPEPLTPARATGLGHLL